jgi:ribonuclease P protein component
VAFAIGRACGPAVVRNRVRRRLRALLAQRDLAPGWYLFGVRPGSRSGAHRPTDSAPAELTSAELMFDLDRLLRRVPGPPSPPGPPGPPCSSG